MCVNSPGPSQLVYGKGKEYNKNVVKEGVAVTSGNARIWVKKVL